MIVFNKLQEHTVSKLVAGFTNVSLDRASLRYDKGIYLNFTHGDIKLGFFNCISTMDNKGFLNIIHPKGEHARLVCQVLCDLGFTKVEVK